MDEPTKREITRLLQSKRTRASYLRMFAFVAALLALVVTMGLRQNGVAATHEEQVLDCHYAGTAAHTHNADCYDADGNLVCTLPERELHTHTDECYTETRELACGLEESDGHHHTDACYDEEGNLICGETESEGHHHTDACYKVTRELTCGKEEVTETHTHGPGCFKTIEVPDATNDTTVTDDATADDNTQDADEKPAQEFSGSLKKIKENGEEQVVLVVAVKAPKGAFPAGTTMKVDGVDPNKIEDVITKAVQKADKDATILNWFMGVDIKFFDAQGNEIQPDKKVEIKITHNKIRDIEEPILARTLDAEAKAKYNKKDDAEVLDQVILANQVDDDKSTGNENTFKFKTKLATTYVLVESQYKEEHVPAPVVTEAEVDAMPPQNFSETFTSAGAAGDVTVTVEAPAGALPEGAILKIDEIAEGSDAYANYLAQANEAADGKDVALASFLDISFVKGGKEIQPMKPVKVEITLENAPTEEAAAAVLHMGNKAQSVSADQNAGTVTFEAERFSVYGVIYTVDSYAEVDVEKSSIVKTIVASDRQTYKITVTYGADAGIPENATLKVAEIQGVSDEYQEYRTKVENTLGEYEQVTFARFFDITILAGGEEVQPKAPVDVRVEMAGGLGEGLRAMHFGNDVEVLDATSEEGAVSFEAKGFSVYGIVGTEIITTRFLSADGRTYEVTVTYGPEAQIPEGSKLEVTEFDKGSDEYKTAEELLIDEETGKVADEDGWFQPALLGEGYAVVPAEDDAGLAVLDISILDADGNEVEPKAAVEVSIVMKELPEVVEREVLEASMTLKHLVEDGDDIVVEEVASVSSGKEGELNVLEDTVEATFVTDSFSLFTFTWSDHTANITVHYVDEQGNELQGPQTSDVTISGNTPSQTFAGANYTAQISLADQQGGISTYDFKEARLGTRKGDVVTSFVGSRSGSYNNYTYTIDFRNGNTSVETYTVPFNAELYFIYKPTEYPSGGDDGTLDKPTTEKKLTPANDGTYTLSLSVKGTAKTNTDNTKANVVVIYDTSNSMHTATTSRYTGYHATNANYGLYGLVGEQYVHLYRLRYGSYTEITNKTQEYETVYINTGGNNYVQYTGTRYNYYNNETLTRHQVATEAVEELADALLSNNTTAVPDMVEMAFVDFATLVNSVNGAAFTLDNSVLTVGANPTTDKDTFLGWLHATYVSQSDTWILGGTDWEEALEVANLISFDDDDPTYVIFVSDGNPTFRVSRNGSGSATSRTSNGRTRNTYGTGGGDDGGYNLDAAIKVANSIIKANKHLYSVGTFGDATNMQKIAGAYYDASDPKELTDAFADIVSSITRGLNVADVKITDGLTDMTASTFVSGNVGNFTYYKNDEPWPKTQMAAEGAAEATVITGDDGSKSVQWAMGEDYKLEAGVEYRVEFTVWPKQKAYDLLAALNNHILEWGEDFTYIDEDGTTKIITYNEYKSEIIKHDDGTYTVMTNTSAGITYSIVSEKDGVETGRTPGSDNITNPTNGMGLDESQMKIRKEWNDSLDPSQLLKLLDDDPDYGVVLHIMNDNNEYVPVTIKPDVTRGEDGKAISATWPTETVYIAPGVMLSTDLAVEKGINLDNYTRVKYGNVEYIVLETGHDYSIDEQNIDYHFELRAETYHPMVVDGVPKNVTFIYGEGGAISGIEAIDTDNAGTIVATNELRAGINLRKVVTDEDGNEVFPDGQVFELELSVKDKGGRPIKFEDYPGDHSAPYDTADPSQTVDVNWDTYPIWYNVYSSATDGGHLTDADIDLDGTYARSDGYVAEDGSTIKIRAGEIIRFANVPIGTQFKLAETNVADGYSFVKYDYKVGKATQQWTTSTDQVGGFSETAAANQSYYLKFTNKQTAPTVRVKKVDSSDPERVLTDTAKFKLYTDAAHTTEANHPDGTPVGEVPTVDGVADLGKLGIGTYYLVETKSPDGYQLLTDHVIISVTENGVTYVQSDYSASNGFSPDDLRVTEDGETFYIITVTNTSGAVLPNSGGVGTQLVLAVGAGMIAAGALVLFNRRRGLIAL